ncbi:MAG: G1 family glutamic endopeptidase [Candidatus Dormibacteria bacterium]|jgi:hypothetical protein
MRLAVLAATSSLAVLGLQGAITAPVGAAPAPGVRTHPMTPVSVPAGSANLPISTFRSTDNWSGYYLDGSPGAYTSVGGCWTVPSVSPGASLPAYSSAWIGIDGTQNLDLIQVGTEQDWDSSTGNAPYAADYFAWWEILPASATPIPMSIAPGDAMCASISEIGTSDEWSISLTDDTHSASFSTEQPYAGPADSAEWIVEAPYATDGSYSCGPCTLADYGLTTFSQALEDGANPDLNPADGLEMIQSDSLVSVPSNPNSQGNGFNLTYVPPAAGWAGYQGLGSGPLGGQPHAISPAPGDLDVFWRGTDNGLWHTWYSGGQWNGPQELAPPGSLASDPSPVSSETGVMDVFWKGTDNNLWHVWYQNGWHGPQSLGGGPLGSAPQPVSWGSGQIDVFWKGTDGNLWHMWYQSGWYGPQSLGGGPLLSTPHPVSWGLGNIDVFWEGPGESLVHEWYANGWQGPQNLGGAGTVASDPEPVSWGPGNIEVFWKGADGNLWQDYFVNGWAGAASLGGPGGVGTLVSNPVPASSGTGLLNVFWQGADGGLWEAYYRNGWVVGARMNEGTIGSAPSTATWPGMLEVFWEGTDLNLWHDYSG